MKRAKRVERSEKHMLSFKMTTYFPYKVNLSEGQKKKLGKAFKANSALTLRLSGNQTSGNDELMLTANQKKRIAKAAALGKGVEIKISKSQIRKVMKQGGSLFSAIIPLARSLTTSFAPTLAKTLGLSALAGLASEGASQVVKKISGKGAMTGGFLIPQDKMQKLTDNKHLLTNKQKQEILAALQSGGQVVVKPTAKQSGGMLGTILASIGIPLALDMVKNLFGKGAPRVGRPKGKGAPRVGRPKGKGAPRLGAPFQRPPPFWKLGTRDGKKKSKEEGLLLWIEKSIQQHPNSRSDFVSVRPKFVNKPLTNFDLLQWVNFLKIPNFKGIFARDEIMPRKHSPCIINLDSLENAGTHWVCCVPGGRALWYFDSFGMGFPQEFKSSKPVIWNSSQFQNIKSVLCGYYCLYFLKMKNL